MYVYMLELFGVVTEEMKKWNLWRK